MLVGAGLCGEGADRRIDGVDSTTFAPTLPVRVEAPARRADTMARVNYPPPPMPHGYGYAPYPAPDHPQANTVLVLGILSFFCGVTGPVAWVMGRRALREIDASNGAVGGRSQVQVGYIMGIVTTLLTALSLLLVVLWIVLVLALGVMSAS